MIIAKGKRGKTDVRSELATTLQSRCRFDQIYDSMNLCAHHVVPFQEITADAQILDYTIFISVADLSLANYTY